MKIKILNLFSLLLMASMFLFLGGCQREEVIQEAKISKSIHTKGYNPVFDTIPKILNGRNALDSLPFQAPTTLQLQQLSENLKTIKSNHNVAQKAVSLKKSGSILSSNYAIITKEISTQDVYFITIPFIKDKVVTAILFYVKFGNNQFLANIYTKADLEINMLSTAVPSNEFYIYYNLVNSLSNYQWIIENTVDKVKVDWLRENARIASRRPSGRCIEYVINVPTVVSMVYSPTNPNSPAPYYTWGTTTMVVPCAQEHNGYIGAGPAYFESGSGSGSGAGSNNPNIQGDIDIELVEKLKALDEDCLRLLQNDMKNELLNSVSLCNQDLLNSQITQAFNKACAEAKQNGGESFLQNVEMWEFTESVREALKGLDYINVSSNLQSLCPKFDCLFDKIINGSIGSDFVCDLMSQFDGSTGSNKGLGFHMHILSSDFTKNPNLDPNAAGVTSILNGRPVISINSSNCNQNNDLFDIFDTFQHEMIHANILQDLLNNGWSGTNTDYASAFHALVQQKYGANAGKTEHELMLKIFINDMVQSLIDANGGKGTFSDFEGLVLAGFGQDLLQYTNITQAVLNSKIANYTAFISNPANVSPNFVSCP